MSFIPGAIYERVLSSSSYWSIGSLYQAVSEEEIMTDRGYAEEGDPGNFRLHEKPTVSRDILKKDTYEFKVSSPDAICHSEIYKGLTRKHPVAIVKRSDGMHCVIVHESLEDKSFYVEDSLRDEYMEAMEPYWSDGYQPYSSGTLKKLLKVLKKLKVAPYKNKKELTCHVELLSI